MEYIERRNDTGLLILEFLGHSIDWSVDDFLRFFVRRRNGYRKIQMANMVVVKFAEDRYTNFILKDRMYGMAGYHSADSAHDLIEEYLGEQVS